MSINSLHSNIVAFLQSQIADPTGQSRRWITYAYPQGGDVTYPKVSVFGSGGSRRPMAMSDQGDFYTQSFQIDIETDTDTNFTVSSHTYAQLDAVTYIADLIKNAIRDNKCTFNSTYNTHDLWLTPLRIIPYQEPNDTYRGIMTLNVQINDPKTQS